MAGCVAVAQAAKFVGLSDLPGGTFNSEVIGVSANGSVVAGMGISASGAEAFRWTSERGMISLGDLVGGGVDGRAEAVSADGSVVAGRGSSASGPEAFRWMANSGMAGLGDLPGGLSSSAARDISDDGSVIVGLGTSAAGTEAVRWTFGTGMAGLGDLPGGSFASVANGVSGDGSVVVGYGSSASGTEAFRWTSVSGMTGLGDLAGGSNISIATAASANGSVVVGQGNSAPGIEAFRWTLDGVMEGLGDLEGGNFQSSANGVSADGSVVVGYGSSTLGFQAFVWDVGNGMRDLKGVLVPSLGAAVNGWTLSSARAVSADGRTIVGDGFNPAGFREGWLVYLADTVDWFPQASGAWDASSSWTGPFLPGPADDVVINPVTSVTVTGPAANRSINSLSLGGSQPGRVTLRLDGTTGDVHAVSHAAFHSNAVLLLANGRIFTTPVLSNHGLIRGTGTLSADLINHAGGEIRVADGESLFVSGSVHSNDGKIELISGSLEFVGPLTNTPDTGLITGRTATLRFRDGLINNGAVALSTGISDVSGDITNNGNLIVSGRATVTFYDDVENNGVINLAVGSMAVFFGGFAGNGVGGAGEIFLEGDTRPGMSPGTMSFGGDVRFGISSSLQIELAGRESESQHDLLEIAGTAALGGALDVSLIDGFMPLAGDRFEIVSAGAGLSGAFATQDLPALGERLMWDIQYGADSITLTVVSIGLPGDYNQNGVVDAADYVVWRRSVGQAGAGLAADGDGNKRIDSGDYSIWRAHFGQTTGSAAGGGSRETAADWFAVPETFALAQWAICLAILLVVRKPTPRGLRVHHPRQAFLSRRAVLAAAVLLVASLLLAGEVKSQHIWIHDGIGNWSSDSTWSAQYPPDSMSDAWIDNGGTAQVTSGDASGRDIFLGRNSGQSGHLQVLDAHASLVARDLYPGQLGSGTITIGGGGRLSSFNSHFGVGSGSNGEVTVTGAASSWTNAGDIAIGYEGRGTLTIEHGASVDVGENVAVGEFGTINLRDGMLRIGGALISPDGLLNRGVIITTGFANVVSHAIDVRGDVFVAPQARLFLDSETTASLSGLVDVNHGTIAASNGLRFGTRLMREQADDALRLVSNTIREEYREIQQNLANYTEELRRAGHLEDSALDYQIQQAMSEYNNANQQAKNTAGKGFCEPCMNNMRSAIVADTDVLGTFVTGGPAAIGSVDVVGDLSFAIGSTLAFELAGTAPGSFDTLQVNGRVALEFGARLELSLLDPNDVQNGVNPFLPSPGEYVDVIVADTIDAEFMILDVPPLANRAFVAGVFDSGNRQVLRITAVPIPEPSGTAFLVPYFALVLAVLARRTRQRTR
jgi:T5SS/PEP-CTERM-associated repeat protein/probable HAF family extracellular repeat protein